MLGAVGFCAEQLEIELKWIDEHVGDKPYGVDIVIPGKYEGKGEDLDAAALEAKLREMIPAEHRDFAKRSCSPSTACPSCPTASRRASCSAGPPRPPARRSR